jgi:hypothetical protein
MAKPYVSAFWHIMGARPDGQLMQVKSSENPPHEHAAALRERL